MLPTKKRLEVETKEKTSLQTSQLGLTTLAGSKHHKGDELPCNKPCCLCESFFFFMVGEWVNVFSGTGSPR